MKILIFTEGTLLMHSSGLGVSREERVRQSASDIADVNNFKTYVPIGNAIKKLIGWTEQGAEIYYLTSRRVESEIQDIREILAKYNFPDNQNLLFRKELQSYSEVAEQLLPDILIEDNCESIGGESEMTYPNMSNFAKKKVHSIVVKEFEGIDQIDIAGRLEVK